jgi:hypothetical protein
MRGYRRFLAVVLLAVIGLAVATQTEFEPKKVVSALVGDELGKDLVGIYSSLATRPTSTADDTAIEHADVNRFGINVFLEQ